MALEPTFLKQAHCEYVIGYSKDYLHKDCFLFMHGNKAPLFHLLRYVILITNFIGKS